MNFLFEQLGPAPRIAVEALLNSTWQGAVLVFFIWLLLRIFRRTNAATKYSVLMSTLLALVCLLFLNTLNSWRAPLAESQALSANLRPEILTPDAVAPKESLRPAPIIPARSRKPEKSPEISGGEATSVKESGTGNVVAFGKPLEPGTPRDSFSIQLGGGRWPQLFLILWALGAAGFMVRLSRSYLSLRRLKKMSRPLAENYQLRLAHWSKACGVRRAVSLRGSKEITVPLVLGLRKTVILFPERLTEDLAEDEFDQVLLHELAHVRRRDDWSNFLQKLIEALLFFHPAVWWAGRRLNAEREIACDQWVISVTGARRSYASCLAKLFELTKKHSSALLSPGATTIKSHLSRRIETILTNKRPATPRFSAAGLLIPLCALSLMLIQLGHVPPVIAISTRPDSAVELSDYKVLAGATALEQPRPEGARINELLENPSGAGELSGVVSVLNDRDGVARAWPEGAALETTNLSASRGELPQERTLLDVVGATGNFSSGAAQAISFVPTAINQRLDISNGAMRPSDNSSPSAQERTASSPALPSDGSSLNPDFFKEVAALGNAGAQREILSAILKRPGLTRENLIRSLVTAKIIDSDGEKAEFLQGAASVCTGDSEVLDAFFSAVSSIESAGERRRVLSTLLTLKGRDRGILARIFKSAAAINSDGEKAELLVKAASLYAIDGATLDAYLAAVSSVNSSAEQRRALTALVRQRGMSSEGLAQTVRFARLISSDGEKAEFLVRVTEVCPMSDSLVNACLATATSIHSSDERARALSAIAKKKEISQGVLTRNESLAKNDGGRD